MENAQQILDALLKYLPIVLTIAAALGLTHVAAELVRLAVRKAKGAAAATPSKLDDVVVGLLGDRVNRIADLLDAGDIEGAKKRVEQIKAVLPK